jgi:8-oxo-dGTP diphosphatase
MSGPPKTPNLAVDAIVARTGEGVLLIERRHPPPGWALPGGFVEVGETVEAAVARELQEETGLAVESVRQFRVYSDPARDPRGHTVSVVLVVHARGEPKGGDDARSARFFPWDALPPLAFDHALILNDYRAALNSDG